MLSIIYLWLSYGFLQLNNYSNYVFGFVELIIYYNNMLKIIVYESWLLFGR